MVMIITVHMKRKEIKGNNQMNIFRNEDHEDKDDKNKVDRYSQKFKSDINFVKESKVPVKYASRLGNTQIGWVAPHACRHATCVLLTGHLSPSAAATATLPLGTL
ncbi:hypothetical protein PIB30_025072 [Stylosanthes scabra]|uniref:Uncharacterized protein n=1 Tax=Stylosanthes scabra TaxID=79078 RepID=A0ABU6U8W1_9FABA|nr:hypothetical protein [Stylosanthes scabra]